MVGTLVAVGLGSLIYGADKSLKLDAKALEKRRKAANKECEAQEIVRKQFELTDKRVTNVVKKKTSIVCNTLPRFAEVYDKLQKVQIEGSKAVKEFNLPTEYPYLKVCTSVPMTIKQSVTDSECALAFLLPMGLAGLMIKDSERELSAAQKQLSAANVVYSQAESKVSFLKAVAERADYIARVLSGFNVLMVDFVEKVDTLIDTNGYDWGKYSKFDKELCLTLVNLAVATVDMVNVPLFEQDGKLAEAAYNMLIVGENKLAEMKNIIGG